MSLRPMVPAAREARAMSLRPMVPAAREARATSSCESRRRSHARLLP
jgi:hypothetical protein